MVEFRSSVKKVHVLLTDDRQRSVAKMQVVEAGLVSIADLIRKESRDDFLIEFEFKTNRLVFD